MKTHSNHSIRRSLLIFLQAVVALVGIGMLAFLLWEPHAEGVNANSAFFEVYLDPFVGIVYLGSVPFFISLYYAWKFLGYIKQDNVFSLQTIRALQIIQSCSFTTTGIIIAVLVYIRLIALESNDDPAGVMALGALASFVSIIIGVAIAVLKRMIQKVLDIKSENDLTV